MLEIHFFRKNELNILITIIIKTKTIIENINISYSILIYFVIYRQIDHFRSQSFIV